MRFDRLSGGEKVIVEILWGALLGEAFWIQREFLIDAFDSTYASRRNQL